MGSDLRLLIKHSIKGAARRGEVFLDRRRVPGGGEHEGRSEHFLNAHVMLWAEAGGPCPQSTKPSLKWGILEGLSHILKYTLCLGI